MLFATLLNKLGPFYFTWKVAECSNDEVKGCKIAFITFKEGRQIGINRDWTQSGILSDGDFQKETGNADKH